MNLILIAALLAAGTGLGDVRVDAVPGQMNLQGYLTDNAGDPVDERVELGVKIYRGGSVQWQETGACTVRSGLFHKVLGSETSIPASVFEPGTECELEVAVEGQTLEPRVALTSSGFAFRSVRSDLARVWPDARRSRHAAYPSWNHRFIRPPSLPPRRPGSLRQALFRGTR